MKSYADRIEDAHKVITRALQAMSEDVTEGSLCYLSWENALTIDKALLDQKRRLERSKPPEG